MIKNPQILNNLEKETIRKENISFGKALALFEAMWKEGITLGAIPPKDPLEGIETDIRIARILNCSKKS